MADLTGLDPGLAGIVQKIIAESGGKVSIVSGYRTRAEQEALYQKYLNGTGNLAAKPGHSQHEHGFAVDFGGDLELAAQLASKYGLVANVPGEPWHFAMGEGANPEGAGEVTGYSPGETENPQDALANRLHSVLRIIGQDATTGTPGSSAPSFEDDIADATFQVGGPPQQMPMAANATDVSHPASAEKSALQQYAAKRMTEMGMGTGFDALVQLWNRESGWDPTAQNPTSTAFGIAQFLNGTWAGTGYEKTSDPYKQIDAGLTYIQQRYGTPEAALAFHNRNNWY